MSDKKEFELPPFVCDDLHFDGREIDGYGKTFNFVVCEREAGKSTFMWKKIYNAFKNESRPSIVLRRQIVDITEQYIEDTITLLEKFTGVRLPLKFAKGDIKQGQLDVTLNDKIFFRVVALSTPMSRLKSMMLRNVKYFMMDEFICNLRLGEKYLTDEPMRVKELYTTYYRETERLKCYFFGNPYSLFNPYFSWLKTPTNRLYPGAIVSGEEYVAQCYKIKPELKEFILKKNPLYKFDNAYKEYAFDGRAVQDKNIRIIETQPNGFRLNYCFKLNNKIVGIYRGYDEVEKLCYWCQTIDQKMLSTRRDIVCFDFGQLADKTVLLNNNGKKLYYYLKESIENRWIAYKDVEASWLIEEIYQEI